MINYETIKSVYDDKLTLLQWLKKVEEALKNATAVEFKVNKRGSATLTFSIVFDDGTELETGDIVLQQGESVTGAAIVGGHLKLTLSNGDVLDAGDLGGVSSFSIDASQHLIVHYQNGTTQDLGAIFSGNVNIAGNLTANSIIENMNGYSFNLNPTANITKEMVYAGAVKNGNKLSLVSALNFTKDEDTGSTAYAQIGEFTIPNAVYERLYPTTIAGSTLLDARQVSAFYSNLNSPTTVSVYAEKTAGNKIRMLAIIPNTFPAEQKNYIRYELTLLLSENLAA